MTHKTFRKVVSLVLASCLIASGIPANASNGEVVTLENENGSVVFTEVVAKEIGEMFSRDLESANESLGKVVETTPMYSATGENLTSYLVKFEKGYAVLNANIDGESQVLEWGMIYLTLWTLVTPVPHLVRVMRPSWCMRGHLAQAS